MNNLKKRTYYDQTSSSRNSTPSACHPLSTSQTFSATQTDVAVGQNPGTPVNTQLKPLKKTTSWGGFPNPKKVPL